MARQVISISIENKELYKRLRETSKILGKTRSAIIKYLLDRYLPKTEEELKNFIEDFTQWEMEKAIEKIKTKSQIIPIEDDGIQERNKENDYNEKSNTS